MWGVGGYNRPPWTKTAFTGRSPGTWAASQGVSRVLGSAVCLWADGCVFCNPVGAPGFGKSWLLSPQRCRASDCCWQLSPAAIPSPLSAPPAGIDMFSFPSLFCLHSGNGWPLPREEAEEISGPSLPTLPLRPPPHLFAAGNPGQKESQHPGCHWVHMLKPTMTGLKGVRYFLRQCGKGHINHLLLVSVNLKINPGWVLFPWKAVGSVSNLSWGCSSEGERWFA